MFKTLLTLSLTLAFSLSAFACDGSGKQKTKEQKPADERSQAL